MFVDEAKIYVKAGDGGDGCNSLHRDKFNRRGRPDGGDGGRGGDVILLVDENVHTLLDFQYRQHFKAESGTNGSSNNKRGRGGEDLYIKVPAGTLIKDARNKLLLRDLAKTGDAVTVARGGDGGKGNSKNRPSEKGSLGEEKTLALELKVIADVGIVGYPNSGKSSLISKLSSARPKVASYPFTTKEPVLGVVKIYDDFSFVVCEIPGLIEGAHLGKGLGDKFLRHIERTKCLIHLVDIAACEGREPYTDYLNLNKELKSYSPGLIEKPQVVALNKIDLPSARENVKKFKKKLCEAKFREAKPAFPISALTGEGIEGLLSAVCKKLKSLTGHGKI